MTADAGEDVEKEEHSSTTGGLQSGTTTLEISFVVPQKIVHRTFCDDSMPQYRGMSGPGSGSGWVGEQEGGCK